MFSRIKGAIDSRIAEEQARHKAGAGVASSPLSTSRTPTSRTESPAAKQRRVKPKEYDATSKIQDPAELENAFVIEDDSEAPSRVGTPAIMDEKTALMAAEAPVDGAQNGGEKASESASMGSAELPAGVQAKLKKLATMESKYKELLRSYRIAHARAVAIEPFERVLKENTSVSSIGEPDALLEYLNQQKLKTDMYMDELKRVTVDRDECKKKFEEVEKQREELASQISTAGDGSVTTAEKGDTSSIDTPSISVKSPMSSVLGLGIFSPKQKAQPTADNKDVSEEFYSYDDEIPQLQAEVKSKSLEVVELQSKITTLETDLALAQETNSDLVDNVEKATWELNETKEAAAAVSSLQDKINAQMGELASLKAKSEATGTKITTLEDQLAKEKKLASEKIADLEGNLTSQKKSLEEAGESESQALKTSDILSEKLTAQIKSLENSKASDAKQIEELSKKVESLKLVASTTLATKVDKPGPAIITTATSEPPAPGAAKKKNKKKKKGGNATAGPSTEASGEVLAEKSIDSTPPTPGTSDLEAEISRLQSEITAKDLQIEKLQTKRKTEEDLREEIENMQENLLNIGQEHVEAKEKIKELQAEKATLLENISKLESEIEGFKDSSKASEKVDTEFKTLTAEYEDLKSKSTTLQTDLGAAQQLATSRYRDLTDLRDVLQKAQPELKTLRAENAQLKSTKEELAAKTSDLRRLEARERDLKADMAIFKKQAADRDNEVRTLNEKITQETNSRLRFEDQNRVAQRDLRKSEAEKIQLAAAGEKSAQELTKAQDELGKLRTEVRNLEDQVSKMTNEIKSLREEVELRGSQYNNSESLLNSMRDQQSEMAMQLKESRDKADSLEEELGDVQRLLSERTREGETMRRLLADVDDRADAKVREMRERMETAIEERDRAEDEASTNGRRRAREVDELKSMIRDFERDLKRATDDRDELQQSEKEWKRKRDELENISEKASQEVNGYRSANEELRIAVDRNEKQLRDSEKKLGDLRRLMDEANQRYEKQNKEFKALQSKQQQKMNDVSSRSSLDTGRSGSPLPVNGTAGKMDYVYLKTILLQFLEQKDKKRQADLVKTVLGQLLHFDKKDQERWISAISAK